MGLRKTHDIKRLLLLVAVLTLVVISIQVSAFTAYTSDNNTDSTDNKDYTVEESDAIIDNEHIPAPDYTQAAAPFTLTQTGGTVIAGTTVYVDESITGNIYVDGTLILNNEDFTITGLVTIRPGGHFYMSAGTITGADTRGVTVSGANSVFVMSGGIITGNSSLAANGGGVSVANGGRFEMSGSAVITNNEAMGSGGGVRILGASSSLLMTGGEISYNRALGSGSGGGVQLEQGALFRMEGGSIHNNNSGTTGGGVVVTGSTFELIDGDIHDNLSNASGGGLRLVGNAMFNMDGGRIFNNQVLENLTDAGGISVNGATVIMHGGHIFNNTATGDGGGVDIRSSNSAFYFHGGTIGHDDHELGNEARDGAGVRVTARASFIMPEGSTGRIIGNTATRNGGGLHALGNSPGIPTIFSMQDGQIYNNRAVNGGGMHLTSHYLILDLIGGTIGHENPLLGNRSSVNGGGIWAGGTSSPIINMHANSTTNILGNTAGSNGGGIHLNAAASTLIMHGGTISGNFATNGGGINVANAASIAAIYGGNITSNNALNDGGGIWTIDHYYHYVLPMGAYGNLTVGDVVVFNNNTAGNGSFRPPINWESTNIRGNGTSPTIAEYGVHQLNNYDVNFRAAYPRLTKQVVTTEDVYVNDTIEYAITVINDHDSMLLGNFTVVDELNTTFVELIENSVNVTRNGVALTATEATIDTSIDGTIRVILYDLPANSETIINFEVLTLPASAGMIVRNSAVMHRPGSGTGTGEIPDTNPIRTPETETTIEASVAPVLTKAAIVTGDINVEDNVQYVITITNSNDFELAGDFAIIDELNTTLVEFVPGSVAIMRDGDILTASDFTLNLSVLGTIQVVLHGLPENSETTITFEVSVLPASAGQTIINIAELQPPPDANGIYPAPILTPPVNVPVRPKEITGPTDPTEPNYHLVLNKQANPPHSSYVSVGKFITYTIFVRNSGSESSGSVAIVDRIPNGMTLVSGSAITRINGVINTTITPNINDNVLTWTIPSIAAGAMVEVSFQVTVDPLPTGVYRRTFRNTATVGGRSTNTVTLNIIEQQITPEYPVLNAPRPSESIAPTPTPTHREPGTPSPVPIIPTSLIHYAYMIGDNHGNIRPNANISRAEVATIFFRLITDEYRAEMWTQINSFPDVEINHWFNNAVSTMTSASVVFGMPDGKFEPNRDITRAEFAVAMTRFFTKPSTEGTNMFPDIEGHWAAAEINAAARMGWVTGFPDGTFAPNQAITRAEVAALVNRILQRLPETEDDLLADMIVWPDNMDTSAWFYLYVQEATNCNYFEMKLDSIHKRWTALIDPRRWYLLELPASRPWDVNWQLTR